MKQQKATEVYFVYCFVSFLTPAVRSQGHLSLTFSENPVYTASHLTMACSFATNVTLTAVTVDAFNGTRREGSLHCNIPKRINTGTGVFTGRHFVGCPIFFPKSGRVIVPLQASPELELEYNCSVRTNDGNRFFNWMSDSARLQVRVMPEAPVIFPSRLVFNETENATIGCKSRFGKPPPTVNLTVSSRDGSFRTVLGNASILLNLKISAIWHNSTTVCGIVNHDFQNMTVVSSVIVNYIVARSDSPLEVHTRLRNQTLNCSADIASFPESSYMWRISGDDNASVPLALNTSTLTVQQGQSGVFLCIAVNAITLKNITVTYYVTNELPNAAQSTSHLISWLIAGLSLFFISITAIQVVLYMRSGVSTRCPSATCFQKGQSGITIIEQSHDHRSEMEADDGRYQHLIFSTSLNGSSTQPSATSEPSNRAEYECLQL